VSGAPVIVEVGVADTYALRRQVLRVGTTSTEVEFPEDALDGTVHLGVQDAGKLIAVSTWITRDYPNNSVMAGCQLRGMVTSPLVQGTGMGSMLLQAGIERARAAGTVVVWANARSSAVGFYVTHGFRVEGPEFVTAATGLAHQRILLRLD
jgi:GNAT superfamily N-acetyltransferase